MSERSSMLAAFTGSLPGTQLTDAPTAWACAEMPVSTEVVTVGLTQGAPLGEARMLASAPTRVMDFAERGSGSVLPLFLRSVMAFSSVASATALCAATGIGDGV